jgi:hypothetical protein
MKASLSVIEVSRVGYVRAISYWFMFSIRFPVTIKRVKLGWSYTTAFHHF